MNKKSEIQAACLTAIGTRKYSGVILGTGAGKTLLGLKHMAKKYTDTSLLHLKYLFIKNGLVRRKNMDLSI